MTIMTELAMLATNIIAQLLVQRFVETKLIMIAMVSETRIVLPYR
jgi:hypothetical protein